MTSDVNDVKTHISNIGHLIEDLETDMRSKLNELYVLKTKEIIYSIRSTGQVPSQSAAHVANLNAAVTGHGKQRKIDSDAN